jgi:hypothetical protein
MTGRIRLLLTAFLLCPGLALAQGSGVGTRIDLTAPLGLNQGSGQFAQIFIPDYYAVPADGKITLVFHLHSASWAAEDEVYRARANAVLFNIHCGALSSPYQAYFTPSRFRLILDTVLSTLDARGIVAGASIRRLVLTSFSAGYAGVREILKDSSSYGRVDALTLADGLHASSDPAAMQVQMADFVKFGADARDRRKIFLLTHSSIPTIGYQSTTQTAEYLLQALGLSRLAAGGTDEIGTALSAADSGCFHLRGYAGESAEDHMKHLYAMHAMLGRVMDLLEGGASGVGPSPRPHDVMLLRNFPNPFNGGTCIRYTLPSPGRIRLAVVDCAGREVALVDDGDRSSGEHLLFWNPSTLSSGAYFLRLSSGKEPGITHKVIVLR